MIYFQGNRREAEFIADDVRDNCPDVCVGTVPCTLTTGGWLNSPVWRVLVAERKDCPMMLQVFSFTDEKLRTFQWGLDDDRGETQIICAVTQDFSIPVFIKDGDAVIEKIRAMQVPGFGKGPTAQIAYDAACADLLVNLRDADAKLRAMPETPTVNVSIDEGPHRLFGKPDEEPRRLIDMPEEK